MKNIVIEENKSLELAYHSASQFAKSHYENFPVVSLFLPKRLRKHIAVVYQFARQADDIADEGVKSVEWRMENLVSYESSLRKCLLGEFENQFWKALHNTIEEFKLSPKHFFDLLSAFKQDTTKDRYESFSNVLDYCERSANPVGRIILEFYSIRNSNAIKYSDSICTALQLTNFYQDVSVDIIKDRIYIPLDELEKFDVEQNQFEFKKINANFRKLLEYQVERNRKLYEEGRKLLPLLPSGLQRQIKMTILGGEKILEKIEAIDYDVLNTRPTLSKIDYLKIFLRSVVRPNE